MRRSNNIEVKVTATSNNDGFCNLTVIASFSKSSNTVRCEREETDGLDVCSFIVMEILQVQMDLRLLRSVLWLTG